MANRSDIIGMAVVFLVLALAATMYSKSEAANLKCIIATKDGQKYCIRDREDLPEAANLMADVNDKMKKLVDHLRTNFPHKEQAKRIVTAFPGIRIVETLPTSELTAYTENKGDKIAMCLNKSKKEGDKKLIDPNTLCFVALHELSHVGTESEGHEPEFWNNFKFVLQEADKIGFYHPVDYKKEPASYCGDHLTDNPLFDL
jgi:hypothetical protein